MSVRSKRCISLIETFGRFKKMVWNIALLQKHLILVPKNAYGIELSPSMWQLHINAIVECLQSRKHCETIMDDLLLFTPSKKAHMAKLEDLLKALLKNRLKIPLKKYQLFKTELQYMGNIIFIRDRKVCVKPLRSRLEAYKSYNCQ